MINHNLLMLRYPTSLTHALSGSSRAILPVASLLVWAGVGFSAVNWIFRWYALNESPSNAMSVSQDLPDVNEFAVAQSLGVASAGVAAAPTLTSRFQLQGVMTVGPNAGAALIAVDGKPAKPFRVGAVVVDGLVLQSAQGRRISLGTSMDGPQTVVLELPAKK